MNNPFDVLSTIDKDSLPVQVTKVARHYPLPVEHKRPKKGDIVVLPYFRYTDNTYTLDPDNIPVRDDESRSFGFRVSRQEKYPTNHYVAIPIKNTKKGTIAFCNKEIKLREDRGTYFIIEKITDKGIIMLTPKRDLFTSMNKFFMMG